MNIDNIIFYIKKNVLTFVPYLLVVILMVIFVFVPVHKHGKHLKKSIQKEKSLLAEYLILDKNKELVRRKHSRFEQFIEVSAKDGNKAPFLYGIIEKLCRKNNLTVGDLRPRIEDDKLVAFDLELTGKMDQILDLMAELDKDFPFIAISSLRLQSLSDRKNIQCSLVFEYLE